MANRYAVATGNWSATGTWDGGTLPGVADIVRPNGFTVTIDQDITVSELRGDASSPAVANGGFLFQQGRTINAKITSGTSGNFITFTGSGSARYVIGDIVVGGGANAFYIASSTDMLYHTGNGSFSGAATGRMFYAYDRSILTLTGNYVAGSAGSARIVEDQTSAAYSTITVTGNLTAGGAEAISIVATFGSPTFVCNGTITASSTMAGVAINSVNQATVCDLVAGANGHVAIRGPAKLLMGGAVQHAHTYRINAAGSPGTARTLYTGGTNLGQPTAANVRSGTVFGASSEYTGTLAVPSPTLVAIGVATDNTVGSYAPSGGLDAAGVRTAIGLATANLDTQISGLSAKLPSALESGRMAAVLNTEYLFDDGFGRKAVNANVTHYQGTLQGNGDLPAKLDAIKDVTNKIDTGLVLDGVVWQFTVNMLDAAIAEVPKYGDAQRHTQEAYNLTNKTVDVTVTKIE